MNVCTQDRLHFIFTKATASDPEKLIIEGIYNLAYSNLDAA